MRAKLDATDSKADRPKGGRVETRPMAEVTLGRTGRSAPSEHGSGGSARRDLIARHPAAARSDRGAASADLARPLALGKERHTVPAVVARSRGEVVSNRRLPQRGTGSRWIAV